MKYTYCSKTTYLCISESREKYPWIVEEIRMRLNRDFQELPSITFDTTDTLLFGSKRFRVIRFFFRLLSIWRPSSAGFLETYIYPVIVNLLLLSCGIIRNSIQATQKSTWLNIQLLYLVHEVVVWLGHILAYRYFASRDLETNVLQPIKPLTGITKLIGCKLKVLNGIMIISMAFFSVMLSTLFIVTDLSWNKGDKRFSATLPHVHGPVDHVLYFLVLIQIVYDLGIGLALFWTLALLYSSYAARLKILEKIFLEWKHSSVDAVSFFMQVYARPVKNSWKRISWWFLAHNIVALAIPLYGYELAQAVSGRAYHSKHLSQFVCYLIFVGTIWVSPIVVGELIKRREKKFLERINDISPWLLEVENHTVEACAHSLNDSGIRSLGNTEVRDRRTHPAMNTGNGFSQNSRQIASLDSIGSNSVEGSDSSPRFAEYTFVCRGKQLKNFLKFLKRRTPGLVSRGYSLQLNISIISLLGGAISFLTELHSANSQNMMYRNCNCTM